jgi:catechol 2,3-dioxygenase-like lactoylglutathione lyase family enzyme
MTVYGFDHVHLVGSDLDASERFYADMFGAETTGRREANGSTNLTMRLDGVNLFIRSPRPGESVSGDGKELRYTYDHFGVVVADLWAAIAELRARGVTILQEPATVRAGTHIAFIEGPDHTRIEVLQRDVPV